MTQKEIAIKCLEKLDVYKPYVRKFKSKAGIPCFFENYGGFYADQDEVLSNKIKALQEEYGVLVYAITHEFSDLGETWSMLCISQNPDSIDDFISEYDKNSFYTYAYVWNKTDDFCSEFGDIIVNSFGGGIKRVY
jgi:hypothetical protein